MRSPETLQPMPTDFLRSSPPFWSAQDNHWPTDALACSRHSCLLLTLPNFGNAVFQRRSHGLVHGVMIRPLDKIRSPAIALEQILQLLMTDSRQQCRVIDFVAVQMQNGQH